MFRTFFDRLASVFSSISSFVTRLGSLPGVRHVHGALGTARHTRLSQKAERLIERSSVTEKVILSVLVATLLGSTGVLLARLHSHIIVFTPSAGGTITEGIVGSPQFINPVLASSEADRTLTSLVYAGLLKRTADGKYVYDLAHSLDISKNGTVYTLTIKNDARFHDGEPVTARDVVYTVRQAKNAQLRSPIRGNWAGVTVTAKDTRTVQFTLSEPYAPFLQHLTMGILPAHIWKPLETSQFSSSPHNHFSPIGAGPYQVTDVEQDQETGLSTYTLTPFSNYVLGEPYIRTLTVRSFASNNALLAALKDNRIDNAPGIPSSAAPSVPNAQTRLETAHLPRTFAVFFNQNKQEIFTSEALREALALVTDKRAIVEQVLHGYGSVINSPAPAGTLATTSSSRVVQDLTTTFDHIPDTSSSTLQRASSTLSNAGWTLNDKGIRTKDGTSLSFSLATSDTSDLVQTARMLKDQWDQLGIELSLEVYSSSNLNQDVIRPRKYEALLFGEIIGRGNDFYPFWHSSQQNDPGLNVAQYANVETDELLEEARKTTDPNNQLTHYREFAQRVANDNPAVFLYTPQFIYAVSRDLSGVHLGNVTQPAERFHNAHDWYMDTSWHWRSLSPGSKRPTSTPVFPVQE